MDISEIPADLTFRQGWRRVVFAPSGERVPNVDSHWYEDKRMARSLLNDEYPEPTETGFRYMLQTRWVSEYRTASVD